MDLSCCGSGLKKSSVAGNVVERSPRNGFVEDKNRKLKI